MHAGARSGAGRPGVPESQGADLRQEQLSVARDWGSSVFGSLLLLDNNYKYSVSG
jgi:hypothetical protein